MRKLFTALAAVCLTASAFADDVTYTADPASGSTLSELSSFTLTSESDVYTGLELKDATLVTITRDGEPTGITLTAEEDSNLTLVFSEPLTKGGTYVIDLPTGSIRSYYWKGYAACAPTQITYVIDDSARPLNLTVNSDPASGSTLTELSAITLTSGEADYPTLEIPDASVLKVTCNGGDFGGVTATAAGSGVTITLDNEVKQSGEYVIVLPKDTWYLTNAAGDKVSSDITLTYTVDIPVAPDPDHLNVNTDPVNGTRVKTLTSVTISSNEAEYPRIRLNAASQMKVTKDGEDFCGVSFTNSISLTSSTITLETPATEPGVYEIILPKDSWNLNDGENLVSVDLVLTYDVEGDTGVEAIGAEATDTAVYNLNGVRVGGNLENLPAGVYVTKGRKVIVSEK